MAGKTLLTISKLAIIATNSQATPPIMGTVALKLVWVTQRILEQKLQRQPVFKIEVFNALQTQCSPSK